MKNFIPASYVILFLLLGLLFACSPVLQAKNVTKLSGKYKNGQVFLTWTNVSDTNTQYRIYRSTSKIKHGSQLPSCEFMGIERYSSANNNNLTVHYRRNIYYSIDSGAAPLSSTTGLCVLTTLQNKSNYYCVTTVSNGIEDTTVKPGSNSLKKPVAETVSTPLPIFQFIDDTSFSHPVSIYADFISSRAFTGGLLRFNAAFMGSDFCIYVPSTLVGPASMLVKFHAGGNDLFHGITVTQDSNQINMGVEDKFPNGFNSVWIGTNKNFDVLNYGQNTVPPTSDTNYTYTLDRLNAEIEWASRHLPVDTNKIYTKGDSFGTIGAYFIGILEPQHIAAVQMVTGDFNLAFDSDWEAECTMNEGFKNRTDGDVRFGTIATNLPSDLKLPFYGIVNGGYDLHHYVTRNIPLVFAINGKYDQLLGWTECISYYDSVNSNHAGGFYLWDLRDHAGDHKTWNDNNFDLARFSKNQSYPALSNCSANGNPGNGTGTSGDTAGTINGFCDWDNSHITDNSTNWNIKLFMRSLLTWNNLNVVPPDSATANVTPRRLQHFSVPSGSTINWSVVHKGKTVQTGSLSYNGGIIIIPGVKIYLDTSLLKVSYTAGGLKTYYRDFDQDSYGNINISVQSVNPVPGYVLDSTDCNDSNAAVHPGVVDICNGIDDNCNNVIDENAFAASATASGNTTFCQPNTVTLNASPTGSSYNYQWLQNGSNINGATKASYSAGSTATFSVRISNNIAGCTFTSNNISVTANPQPTVSISPSGTINDCKGVSETFTATTDIGNQFQWYNGSSQISGATSSTYRTSLLESGVYSVVTTSNAGCSNTSNSTTLNRLATPNPKITAQGSLNICQTHQVVLQASTAGSQTYQWLLNNVNISGATKSSYTATVVGNYTVTATNTTDGCSATSAAVVVFSSCRSEDNPSVLPSIYPNPNRGQFTVSLNDHDAPATVEVRNLLGSLLLRKNLAAGENTLSIQLPENIPSGIYFVRILIGTTSTVQKVTVQE